MAFTDAPADLSRQVYGLRADQLTRAWREQLSQEVGNREERESNLRRTEGVSAMFRPTNLKSSVTSQSVGQGIMIPLVVDEVPPTSPEVNLQTLISGYMHAHDRFELARGDRFNHLPAYWALFEALAWSYSIDQWLKRPDQVELRGLRYARNRVHHQWHQALWMDLGGELPLVLGRSMLGVASEWRWKDNLGRMKSDDADASAYRDHLAGRPARVTLNAVRAYLARMVDDPVSMNAE